MDAHQYAQISLYFVVKEGLKKNTVLGTLLQDLYT
jgi:hypothetical protein